MTENKKLFLIANPKSGRARIKYDLLSIINIFTRGGYTTTVYPTAKRGDATKVVKNLSDEYDTIVCCGGDGTLNEVITGVMYNKNNYKIGYIPSGTLNEWSSGLHISRNAVTAAKDILKGNAVPLDIGKFNDSYFSYTASFGAFTEASYSANQNVKNVLGQAAYFFEGIKSLGNIKPIHLKVESENFTEQGDYLFGAVSNSLSVGGIIKLDQSNVVFNDGIFEIILIKNPDNLIELQDTIDGVVKRDFNRKCIRQFSTKEVTITECAGVPWTLDGEYAEGSDKIVIKNINKAINFLIP